MGSRVRPSFAIRRNGVRSAPARAARPRQPGRTGQVSGRSAARVRRGRRPQWSAANRVHRFCHERGQAGPPPAGDGEEARRTRWPLPARAAPRSPERVGPSVRAAVLRSRRAVARRPRCPRGPRARRLSPRRRCRLRRRLARLPSPSGQTARMRAVAHHRHLPLGRPPERRRGALVPAVSGSCVAGHFPTPPAGRRPSNDRPQLAGRRGRRRSRRSALQDVRAPSAATMGPWPSTSSCPRSGTSSPQHEPFDSLPGGGARPAPVGDDRASTSGAARAHRPGRDNHHLYVLRSGAAEVHDAQGSLVDRGGAGCVLRARSRHAGQTRRRSTSRPSRTASPSSSRGGLPPPVRRAPAGRRVLRRPAGEPDARRGGLAPAVVERAARSSRPGSATSCAGAGGGGFDRTRPADAARVMSEQRRLLAPRHGRRAARGHPHRPGPAHPRARRRRRPGVCGVRGHDARTR